MERRTKRLPPYEASRQNLQPLPPRRVRSKGPGSLTPWIKRCVGGQCLRIYAKNYSPRTTTICDRESHHREVVLWPRSHDSEIESR
jgi:hypothetical protein